MIALKDDNKLIKVTFSLHGTCYDKMTKLSLGSALHLTCSKNIEDHQKSCDLEFSSQIITWFLLMFWLQLKLLLILTVTTLYHKNLTFSVFMHIIVYLVCLQTHSCNIGVRKKGILNGILCFPLPVVGFCVYKWSVTATFLSHTHASIGLFCLCNIVTSLHKTHVPG